MRKPSRTLTTLERHIARWRGEHIAQIMRLIERGEKTWVRDDQHARYLVYDSRTTEKRSSSASPRIRPIESHVLVDVPDVRTLPLTLLGHSVSITPAQWNDTRTHMVLTGVDTAWTRYVLSDHPPSIYRPHRRDGVIPTVEGRVEPWIGIRTAVLLAALPTIMQETGAELVV